VEYKNISFNVWDIGGQDKIRALWRHYYEGTQGIIFVVDSNDVDRLPAAKKELAAVLAEPELEGASLLVYANKQDLPRVRERWACSRWRRASPLTKARLVVLASACVCVFVCLCLCVRARPLWQALSTSAVTEQLGLYEVKGRTWHVQGATATTGDGLVEGLDWMSGAVAKAKAGKK